MKSPFPLWIILSIAASSFFFLAFSYSGEAKSEDVHLSEELIIPDDLLDATGERVSSKKLEGKFVGLYFSASWCGPCRKFTPKLIEFRDQYADDFEVILVGGDGSKKAQANYMKKYAMPWLAMENQCAEAKLASKLSEVEYIPYLVILDSHGKIVTKSGKADIDRMGQDAFTYWKDL
jgi:nucleoredoxin